MQWVLIIGIILIGILLYRPKSTVHKPDYAYSLLLADRLHKDIQKLDKPLQPGMVSAVVEKFRSLNAALNGSKAGTMVVKHLRSLDQGGGGIATPPDDQQVDQLLDKHDNLIHIVYPKL